MGTVVEIRDSRWYCRILLNMGMGIDKFNQRRQRFYFFGIFAILHEQLPVQFSGYDRDRATIFASASGKARQVLAAALFREPEPDGTRLIFSKSSSSLWVKPLISANCFNIINANPGAATFDSSGFASCTSLARPSLVLRSTRADSSLNKKIDNGRDCRDNSSNASLPKLRI